jgi:ribosomal protein S18 acetylase RimI-like enzyme
MPGEAYIWDCATAPSYRRLRLYTTLLIYIAEQLHAEGLCRVWIGVDVDNTASQNGIALAGFQPVADLVVTRVIGLRQFWVRSRPSVPEHVADDARHAYWAIAIEPGWPRYRRSSPRRRVQSSAV